MESCPPEILLKIFTFACIDGGFIGCTLSLVCKCFQDVSSTVRLQSIAVDRVTRMRLLLDMLSRRPPALRRVKHLLLSDRKAYERRTLGGDKDDGHYAACAAIVGLVGSELITLTILLSSYVTLNTLTPSGVDLSRLENLVVECSNFGDSNARQLIPPNLSPPSLPSLRYLHLYGMSPYGVEPSRLPLLDTAAASAPALTHLRLSNVYELESLPASLAAALGVDDTQLGKGVASVRLPMSLCHLIVQPANIDYGGPCDFGEEEHDSMILHLAKLSAADERVSLVEACYYRNEDCMEDWLDVIRGGDGCWRMPPSKTTSSIRLEMEMEERRRMGIVEEVSYGLFD